MDLENLTIDLKMIIFEISDILGKPINKGSFEIPDFNRWIFG